MPLMRRLTVTLTAAVLTISPAVAQDWVLDCKMTDYRRAKLSGIAVDPLADARLKVKEIVPITAIHHVNIPKTQMQEPAYMGAAKYDGRTLTLTYIVDRKSFGAVTITYTYKPGSGNMFAKLRAQVPGGYKGPWTLDGIVGTCKRRAQ